MRRAGLEWAFRLAQEPRRLWRRYTRDFWVFGWKLLVQCALLSHQAVRRFPRVSPCAGPYCVLDLSKVTTLDSTGLGHLLVLQKQMRATGRELVLAAPSAGVQRALGIQHLQGDFFIAPDVAAARRFFAALGAAWPSALAPS
jgi:anti-anti-sigma factor